MKPPFGRQGNKMPIIKEILSLVPDHNLYVELFTGSGALFFNKEPVKSILNDLDDDVYNRLKLLKKTPLFPYQEMNTLEKIKEQFDKPIRTIEDGIIYYKIKSSTGFTGTPINKSSGIYKPYNPYRIVKELPIYKELLKKATLTNKDYSIILKKYDSPTTFFFLDPPYENTSKDFYKDTTFDYEKLKDILDGIQGLFMLTLNDSPYIRKLFKEYVIKKIKIQTFWQSSKGISRNELIIMNYKL